MRIASIPFFVYKIEIDFHFRIISILRFSEFVKQKIANYAKKKKNEKLPTVGFLFVLLFSRLLEFWSTP